MRIQARPGLCEQPDGQQDGWAYQKSLTWGVTEVNSWVLLSKIAGLRSSSDQATLTESDTALQVQSIKADLKALVGRQHDNGGWAPIAKTEHDGHLRTYSTIMALWTLVEAKRNKVLG